MHWRVFYRRPLWPLLRSIYRHRHAYAGVIVATALFWGFVRLFAPGPASHVAGYAVGSVVALGIALLILADETARRRD